MGGLSVSLNHSVIIASSMILWKRGIPPKIKQGNQTKTCWSNRSRRTRDDLILQSPLVRQAISAKILVLIEGLVREQRRENLLLNRLLTNLEIRSRTRKRNLTSLKSRITMLSSLNKMPIEPQEMMRDRSKKKLKQKLRHRPLSDKIIVLRLRNSDNWEKS